VGSYVTPVTGATAETRKIVEDALVEFRTRTDKAGTARRAAVGVWAAAQPWKEGGH